MSSGPIYIGGASYSGKTQLRLLLSSLPNILISRRTYLWRKFYAKYGDLNDAANFEACLSEILKLKAIQGLNPSPDRIRTDFRQSERTYARLFALFHQHYVESMGKHRWGIQIGMVEKEADLLMAAEPDAKILQVLRNPFDRVEESLSKSKRRRISVGWETSLWRESTRFAMQNVEKYPERYQIVKWEDLLEDVDATLHKVCEFLGEEYRPALLGLEGVEEIGMRVRPDSNPEQRRLEKKEVSQPNRLSKSDRAFIWRYAREESIYFGYQPKQANLRQIEPFETYINYPWYLLGIVLRKCLNLLKHS